MGSSRFVRAADLQKRPLSLLREITVSGEPCYITQNGKAKAVIIDINRYNALMDLVEETESLRGREIGDETRKHASVRGILSESGRLKRYRH